MRGSLGYRVELDNLRLATPAERVFDPVRREEAQQGQQRKLEYVDLAGGSDGLPLPCQIHTRARH